MDKKDTRKVRPERFIWDDDEEEEPITVIRYDIEARQEVELLLEEQARESGNTSEA